jgi:hypothetical protein
MHTARAGDPDVRELELQPCVFAEFSVVDNKDIWDRAGKRRRELRKRRQGGMIEAFRGKRSGDLALKSAFLSNRT